MRSKRPFFLVLLLLFAASLECTRKPADDDDDPGNTETGDNLDPEDVIEVGIRPTMIQIDSSTELDIKAHARTRDGGWYDTIGGTWTTSDESIATIDAEGHLIPVTQGSVQIGYRWEELEAEPATVEIVPAGRVEVTVMDWLTNEPLAGFQVGVGGTDGFAAQGTTDDNGFVVIEGAFAGPVTVTAWNENGGHRHGSHDQVAAREIQMVLYPNPYAFGSGTMEGQIQFDEEEVVPGKVAVGLAVPSVYASPIYVETKDLLGKDQNLDGFNLSWTLPENVQINGLSDTFKGEVAPGRRVVFGAGGAYELGTILALAMALEETGAGAVFPTMTSHIEDLRVGYSEPIEFQAEGEEAGITLDLKTDLPLETWLDVAPPPAGHYWPDPILVLSWREYQDAGYVAVGFGTGSHPYLPEGDPPADDDDDSTRSETKGTELEERIWVPVREAARDGVFEDVPTRHHAIAVENGMELGSRYASVVSPPTMRERVRLPDFLELVETAQPAPDARVFDYTAPPGADFSMIDASPVCADWAITGWTVFTPAQDSFHYPEGPTTIGVTPCQDDNPGTTFNIDSFSLEVVSYQSLINAHDEPLNEMWIYANRRTYAMQFGPDASYP